MNTVVSDQESPTMYFIGVTTKSSSIMKLFPLWMEELGRRDVRLQGLDLPLRAAPESYRDVVAQIKSDPLSLGALVTTHKISVFEAARDMFDSIDSYAELSGEVSSISKNNGRLEGHAKDPITAGLALDDFLSVDYFQRTGGHVLCLGAGGSATAIALHLLLSKRRPSRLLIVDRDAERIQRLRPILSPTQNGTEIVWHCHSDAWRNDELVAALPPGSLIINATGLGKDQPGSPLTNSVQFPQRSIAWELNYRGELDFLHQALGQPSSGNITVRDGWIYFLHGWTQVIAQVLHAPMDQATFHRLAKIAETCRNPANRTN